MPYTKLIEEIVDNILDETTFLRAYKQGILSPEDVRAASAMRREASKRAGEKIGVVSADASKDRDSSYAVDKSILDKKREEFSQEGEYSYLYKKDQQNPTRRLERKLESERPFVSINLKARGADKPITTMSHELGHLVDPVQNDPEHRKAELAGRNRYGLRIKGARPFESDYPIFKSEGRAWRMGRDLMRATGTFAGKESEWESNAQDSLKGYMRRFLPNSK